MSRQALDRKIEALEALRSAPQSPTTLEQLRKALKDRNNYAVSKAAAVVSEIQLRSLIPDLLAAFERYLIDPAKSDPQCWAKNAIARALKDLGHRDAAVYLLGIAHFQPEPVWGGQEDTATTLRGICVLALAGCEMDELAILTHLVELLADPGKTVRIDAAQAIAQLSRTEGALVLRLKALTGDRDPEVTGQCLASLLSIAPRDSISFVARFLTSGDPDIRMEAAGALAGSREAEAVEALKRHWNQPDDPEVKRAILSFLGPSPAPEAANFLLSVLAAASGETAADALAALSASRYRSQLHEQIAAAVATKGDPQLTSVFEDRFGRP